MEIDLIAAIGKDNELGKNGDLIWRFKEDMKFFKDTTMGNPIVMGRKTFESIKRPLPGRDNIVISKSGNVINDQIKLYKSIKEFLEAFKDYEGKVMIIGGASIYEAFIDKADKLYLTEIDATDKDADVYFPSFNKEDYEKEEISNNEEQGIKYKHVLYKKKDK